MPDRATAAAKAAQQRSPQAVKALKALRRHGIRGLRRSAPQRLKVNRAAMRRRASWHVLSRAELRLLMSGLLEWEMRSQGPMRARLRRKRMEAIDFFRRVHGPLASDRLWVAPVTGAPRRGTVRHQARTEQWSGSRWRLG